MTFDRNGNGKIDDGNELFGPRTNNGFAELALLDDDHNGWIDAGDSMFARLGVWNPAQQGIASLLQAGVGALGLAHRNTPFELVGAGNLPLGNIAASGVFLGTDGTAHGMHDLNLENFASKT